jgi:uncharacterized protein YbbK (DUF523 family)
MWNLSPRLVKFYKMKQQPQVKLLKIGVSACLLGELVRYDGGHKRSQTLLQHLAGRYELLPVCPEVAAGLGTPRPPVQLVVRGGEIRALGVENELLDVTQPLVAYGHQLAHGQIGLCGFIFKSRSPSCGLGSTSIRGEDGQIHSGNGLFTQQLIEALPLLPVIDEEALEQPQRRQQFLQQVEECGRRGLTAE